jgi:hypothetical protein
MATKHKSKFNADHVSLVLINVIKSNIHFDQFITSDKALAHQMKMGKEIDYNFEAKMCRVKLLLEFDALDKDEAVNECIKASFAIDFHFKVDNMDDCITKNDESIAIDSTMPAHLVGIAYSTARGIVLERLSNSPFQGLILPIINPYEVLKEKS